MSRKLASIVALAVVCVVGVPSAEAQRPQRGERQQYTVVASEESFILVDQRSGRTWMLAHSPAGGTPAWVPIERIDDPEEAEQWRNEQHELAERREREHHEQRQIEMRERLEERRREMAERREEFEERARREREDRMRDERERDEREQREPERDEPERREREERERSERPQRDAIRPGESEVRERLQRLGEQTRRGMVESLEKHRQRLIEQFGEDHSAVRAIGEQIERLTGKLQQDTDDVTDQRKDTRRDGGSDRPPTPPARQKAIPQEEDDRSPGVKDLLKRLAAQLQDLRNEEESLLRFFGEDHPKVRAQQRKAKAIEQLIEESQLGEQSAELVPLLLEELELVEKYGPKHPELQAIRKKIELQRKQIEKSAARKKGAGSNRDSKAPAEPADEPEEPGETDGGTDADAADSTEDQ